MLAKPKPKRGSKPKKKPAAMLQDRYALSFSHALTGVYDHETTVVFEE